MASYVVPSGETSSGLIVSAGSVTVMNGGVAIKTANGYKTYDNATGRLTNCSDFVFNIGEEFFFVIPANRVKKGDIILLCSDGLSNMVADNEIYDIINENRDDLALSADILIDHANKNGGKDNITVVLIKIED